MFYPSIVVDVWFVEVYSCFSIVISIKSGYLTIFGDVFGSVVDVIEVEKVLFENGYRSSMTDSDDGVGWVIFVQKLYIILIALDSILVGFSFGVFVAEIG